VTETRRDGLSERLRAIRAEYIRKHGRVPRFTLYPEPGYWAISLTKGGVEVAARIYWTSCPDCGSVIDDSFPPNISERSPTLAAEINGAPVAIEEVWHRRGRDIDEAEYRFLIADRAWARQHAPNRPEANPTTRVDPLTAPLPF
jgi:hypothetical protein